MTDTKSRPPATDETAEVAQKNTTATGVHFRSGRITIHMDCGGIGHRHCRLDGQRLYLPVRGHRTRG